MIKGYSRTAAALKQQSLLPAVAKQRVRLAERKKTARVVAVVNGVEFVARKGVYQTSIDTELMAEVVRVKARDRVLEIGCGCGAVSLLVAKKCREVVGVDINAAAVANAQENRARTKIKNAEFRRSDVFAEVEGRYDVIICNPPYNNHRAKDTVEQMFWDDKDEMKRRFFKEVTQFLKPRGRIYFG